VIWDPYLAAAELAGGSILPLQQSAMTTAQARRTPFHLLVALAEDGTAAGDLFLDDGESPEMGGARSEFSLVKFSCATWSDGKIRLRSQVVHNSYAPSRTLVISKVVIMGLQSTEPPRNFAVYVNGAAVQFNRAVSTSYRSRGGLGAAHVGGLSLVVGEEFELKVAMSY
jgi:alpha-glucosidase